MESSGSASIDLTNPKSLAFSKFKELDKQITKADANVPLTKTSSALRPAAGLASPVQQSTGHGAKASAVPSSQQVRVQNFSNPEPKFVGDAALTSTLSLNSSNNARKLDINMMAALAQSEAATYTLGAAPLKVNAPVVEAAKPTPKSDSAPAVADRAPATLPKAANTESKAVIESQSVVNSAFAKFREIGGSAPQAYIPAAANRKSLTPTATAWQDQRAQLPISPKIQSDDKTASVTDSVATTQPSLQLQATKEEVPVEHSQSQASEEEVFNSKAALFEKFYKMEAANNAGISPKTLICVKTGLPAQTSKGTSATAPVPLNGFNTEKVGAASNLGAAQPVCDSALPVEAENDRLEAEVVESQPFVQKTEQNQQPQILNGMPEISDRAESSSQSPNFSELPTGIALSCEHEDGAPELIVESVTADDYSPFPAGGKPMTDDVKSATLVQRRKKTLEASNFPLTLSANPRLSVLEDPQAASQNNGREKTDGELDHVVLNRKMSTKTNMNMLAAILSASSNSGGATTPGVQHMRSRSISAAQEEVAGKGNESTGLSKPQQLENASSTLSATLSPTNAVGGLVVETTVNEPVKSPAKFTASEKSAETSPAKGKKSPKDGGSSIGKTAIKMATSIARKILLPKKEPIVVSSHNLSAVAASQASIDVANAPLNSEQDELRKELQPLEPRSSDKAVPNCNRSASEDVRRFSASEPVGSTAVGPKVFEDPLTAKQLDSLAELELQLGDSCDVFEHTSDKPNVQEEALAVCDNASNGITEARPLEDAANDDREVSKQAREPLLVAEDLATELVSNQSKGRPTSIVGALRQQKTQSPGFNLDMPVIMAAKQETDSYTLQTEANHTPEGTSSGPTATVARSKRSDSNIMRPCLPEAVNSDLIAKMQARMQSSNRN